MLIRCEYVNIHPVGYDRMMQLDIQGLDYNNMYMNNDITFLLDCISTVELKKYLETREEDENVKSN